MSSARLDGAIVFGCLMAVFFCFFFFFLLFFFFSGLLLVLLRLVRLGGNFTSGLHAFNCVIDGGGDDAPFEKEIARASFHSYWFRFN